MRTVSIAAGLAALLGVGIWAVTGLSAATGPDQTPEPWRAAAWKLSQSGQAALNRKEYGAALHDLEAAAVADPRNPNTFLLLGRAEEGAEQYVTALKYYDTVLSIDPNQREALAQAGRILLKKNRPEAARKNQARLQNLCPTGCAELESLNLALQDAASKQASAK